jgi:membrane protease YdiL (CAAX protease family)
MSEYIPRPELSDDKLPINHQPSGSLWSLFSFMLVMVGGYILSNALAVGLVPLITGVDVMQMGAISQHPSDYENAWQVLMLTQAIAFAGAFLITPLLYLKWIDRQPLSTLNPNPRLSLMPLLAIIFLVICLVPFNDLIIQWNNSLSMPEPLKWIEFWMRDMEDKMREMTQVLTDFSSPVRLLVGFLVIAVLPGIGEELVFRGLLQNKLQALTRNPHVAIWVAAIIFSAIHFQFYGFLPRMVLGALFGYLYVWSGNLWVPILAHFVNNAFTLLMVYLYQQKISDYDAEGSPVASLPLSMGSLLITVGILFYLYTYFKNQRLVRHS